MLWNSFNHLDLSLEPFPHPVNSVTAFPWFPCASWSVALESFPSFLPSISSRGWGGEKPPVREQGDLEAGGRARVRAGRHFTSLSLSLSISSHVKWRGSLWLKIPWFQGFFVLIEKSHGKLQCDCCTRKINCNIWAIRLAKTRASQVYLTSWHWERWTLGLRVACWLFWSRSKLVVY